MWGALLLLVALLPVTAAARPVTLGDSAPPRALEPAVELMVLHARNVKLGIDARLRDLPELKKPPFAAFDTYALLERVRVPLPRDKRATHRLPNGRVLGSELLAVEKDGTVRLSASISEPGGSAFLPLLEVRARVGQRFIVAGQSYRGGILVLVLTLVR